MSMFIQHTFITAAHKPTLESCVRNHPPLASLVVARLYKLALEALDVPNSATHADTVVSTIKGESVGLASGLTIGTATDIKTGVYVQLSRVPGSQQPLMTLGKKWAAEGMNASFGCTGTVIYPD